MTQRERRDKALAYKIDGELMAEVLEARAKAHAYNQVDPRDTEKLSELLFRLSVIFRHCLRTVPPRDKLTDFFAQIVFAALNS